MKLSIKFAAVAIAALLSLSSPACAGVVTTFTGTFDLFAGTDSAGLNGATLSFVTTTDTT